MAIVQAHHSVVLSGQLHDGFEVDDVGVHGEHALSDDDALVECLGLDEQLLEVGEVDVPVDEFLGFAQLEGVDDGGVVEFVGEDGVFRAEVAFEEAEVGLVAGGVDAGLFGAVEFCEFELQLVMNILRVRKEGELRIIHTSKAQKPYQSLYHPTSSSHTQSST